MNSTLSTSITSVVTTEDPDVEMNETWDAANRWAYLVIATFILVGNVCIIIPIYKFRAFHKKPEYVALAGVSLSDLLGNGATYFASGLYRHVAGKLGLTNFGCALLPHNVLFTFAYSASGLALTVMSIERVVLLAYPLWHLQHAVTLTKALLFLVYVHGAVQVVIVYTVAYLNEHAGMIASNQNCRHWDMMPGYLFSYETQAYIMGNVASVLIFAVVILMYARRNRRTAAQDALQQQGSTRRRQGANASAEAAQRAMTVRLAKSTVATFIFVVVLMNVALWMEDKDAAVYAYFNIEHNNRRQITMYAIAMLNPAFNVYLFFISNKVIRTGLVMALRGKNMPDNLSNWQTTRQSTSVRVTAAAGGGQQQQQQQQQEQNKPQE